jgi:hypothetical protein
MLLLFRIAIFSATFRICAQPFTAFYTSSATATSTRVKAWLLSGSPPFRGMLTNRTRRLRGSQNPSCTSAFVSYTFQIPPWSRTTKPIAADIRSRLLCPSSPGTAVAMSCSACGRRATDPRRATADPRRGAHALRDRGGEAGAQGAVGAGGDSAWARFASAAGIRSRSPAFDDEGGAAPPSRTAGRRRRSRSAAPWDVPARLRELAASTPRVPRDGGAKPERKAG